jgi:integrase
VSESEEEKERDLSRLVVSRAGRVVATGDAAEPFRVVGPDGGVVEPVSVLLRDLMAAGRSGSTLRSYAGDLLRWWRFLDAADVGWDRACRGKGLQLLDPAHGQAAPAVVKAEEGSPALAGGGSAERGDRQAVPKRIPRAIPDEWFNRLFASLPSDRDRALVAFWISTGARASELLGMRQCDFRPGEQLISVVRNGSRAVQELPAPSDAFVWHRLYQQELLRAGVPRGRRQPTLVDAAEAVLHQPHRAGCSSSRRVPRYAGSARVVGG